MAYFLAGLAVLAIGLVLSGAFARANTGALANMLRGIVGIVVLAAGVFASVRGALQFGVPLALFGLYLISRAQSGGVGRMRGGGGSGQATGPRSTVETRYLRVALDLQTGDVDGVVKLGPFKGRALEDLSPAELADLWRQCTFDDPESAQILEAYLDRRHPTWREDAARAAGGSRHAGGSDGMTVAEARQILGVSPSASRQEINAAYKRCMKDVHPDRGGTDADAARINQAKDILMG